MNELSCVYLIVNSYKDLPPFYIGSTTIKRINEGYKGSVSSKKYKKVWKDRIKANPSKFRVIVLSIHDTRKDALEEELRVQKENNVVKSDLFINMSFAQKDGFFGAGLCGEDSPMYGKKHSTEVKSKMSSLRKGVIKSEEHKENLNKTLLT